MQRAPSSIVVSSIASACALLAAACGHGAGSRETAPLEIHPSRPASSSSSFGASRAAEAGKGGAVAIDERDRLAMPPPLPREEAERKAKELLAAASIDQPYDFTEEQSQALAKAGFDEELGLALLTGLLDGCLDVEGGACAAQIPGGDEATMAFYRLLRPLARIGSARSIALFARLGEHGFTLPELASPMLEARAAKRMRAACAPPSQAEIERELADLDDFVIVDADHDARFGREPSPRELSDLAYFFAGIRRDRGAPEVEPVDVQTEAVAALAKEHEAARLSGDRDAIVRIGLAYFAAVDHDVSSGPRPLHRLPDQAGPIARSLARELELRGRFAEAAVVYRQGFGEPRAGCDGTSTVLENPLRQAIVRAEEASGDCHGAIASRLFAPDETALDVHGPKRLSRAGWDVPRLYRGAALTIHRRELAGPAGANAFLSADQAERTAGRLERWGNEAYDDELRALEGLADTGRLSALPVLSARIARGASPDRLRAMQALTQLAERPSWDVCGTDRVDGDVASVGGGSERIIRRLNETCRTQLTQGQRKGIVSLLADATKDRDWEVRVGAAQAIGHIATGAPPELTALLRDPEAPFAASTSPHPVREAARVAIAQIRAASRKKKAPLPSTAARSALRHSHRTPCRVAL